SLKGYTLYYPFAALFGIGLILLLFATILDKIVIAGAGIGGWGIASLFASAIGFIIAAILDTYAQEAYSIKIKAVNRNRLYRSFFIEYWNELISYILGHFGDLINLFYENWLIRHCRIEPDL